MNDDELEARINALRLNAARVTLSHIKSLVVAETYTVLPSGKVTVCELTLKNGFTVRGESAVVSLTNYNAEIARTITREAALHNIWQLEGYLLQQRLYEQALEDAGDTSPDGQEKGRKATDDPE